MDPAFGIGTGMFSTLTPSLQVDASRTGSYFVAGAAVGAGVATVVVVGAPVAASGLVAVGFTETAAAATVTGGLLVGGAYGAYQTGVHTYQNAAAGNWDAVAFNVGTVAGGAAVGTMPLFGSSSGGRYLADTLGESAGNGPSPAPPMNLFNVLPYELRNVYNPFHPDGNTLTWLASAPTPFSGGFSAAGTASGVATSFTGK